VVALLSGKLLYTEGFRIGFTKEYDGNVFEI
jgi:hypothetical protein